MEERIAGCSMARRRLLDGMGYDSASGMSTGVDKSVVVALLCGMKR